MGVDPRQPGLFVGPHFEEVLSGVDLSGFRTRLTDEGALALFDYWCRLLREHGLRLKAAFDPTAVPRALSNTYLEEYDAERRPGRMRPMGETLNATRTARRGGRGTEQHARGTRAEP